MPSLFSRWKHNESGSTLIMVAFGIMALLACVGTAVDIGRGQLMQSKLQNALDAAGLAAGASVNSTDIEAEVLKYVNLNFATNLQGAIVTDIDPVLSADGKVLTVTATANMPTSFMGLFGHDTMDLGAVTEVTRSNKGMELVLVLDTTGSMEGEKLTALKAASHDLVEILFGENVQTAENLWIGVVPFSMAVNVGNSHEDWLNQTHYDALNWGSTEWQGCVEARYTGRDITDDPPSAEALRAYYWADHEDNNNWISDVNESDTDTDTDSSSERICSSSSTCRCSNYTCGCDPTTTETDTETTTTGDLTTTTVTTTETTVCVSCSGSGSRRNCNRTTTVETTTDTTTVGQEYTITDTQGPNTYCPSEVTRLTNVRGDIEDGIDALVAHGGTHIPTGAVWGWRMLSPNWQGLWGGSMNTNNLPLDYDTDLMMKAVILMTDGENTMYDFADGAYGYLWENQLGTTSASTAAVRLNDKVTAICNAMEEEGIIVYTVVFNLNNTNVETMMRNCASQPDYFFNSPNAATLQQAFRTIGDSLANLRISQ